MEIDEQSADLIAEFAARIPRVYSRTACMVQSASWKNVELYFLTESKSNASTGASSRDCFRRRLNFISGPFLTSVGQATNPRIKSNAIRGSRSPERGKSNLGSGKGEILKARAEVPALNGKRITRKTFGTRGASNRSGVPKRASSPFILPGLIIYRGGRYASVNSRQIFRRGRERRARTCVYAMHVAT